MSNEKQDAVAVVQEGPTITIKRSCFDCAFKRSEPYWCQGDSGSTVRCSHPNRRDDGYIGDSNWRTPDWCPFLQATTAPATDKDAEIARLREALERVRQGYRNILEFRELNAFSEVRYGALTRDEIEGIIAEIDAALTTTPQPAPTEAEQAEAIKRDIRRLVRVGTREMETQPARISAEAPEQPDAEPSDAEMLDWIGRQRDVNASYAQCDHCARKCHAVCTSSTLQAHQHSIRSAIRAAMRAESEASRG